MAMADRAISEPMTIEDQVLRDQRLLRICLCAGKTPPPRRTRQAGGAGAQGSQAVAKWPARFLRQPAARKGARTIAHGGRTARRPGARRVRGRIPAQGEARNRRARRRRSAGALAAAGRQRRVSPGVFVPMAEELGLISKLGNCVMRDACFAAAGWNRNGRAKRIAVNVSPHQFSDPDFVSSVQLALDESGLNPELLELEITELRRSKIRRRWRAHVAATQSRRPSRDRRFRHRAFQLHIDHPPAVRCLQDRPAIHPGAVESIRMRPLLSR